jgi:transcriptional regulator with XRE-family HTH domain
VSVAEQFGANLVYLRKRAGLSQEEVGFLADLHRTEIGMLERGIRQQLAGALELTPGELLDGIEWKPGAIRRGHFGDAGEAGP